MAGGHRFRATWKFQHVTPHPFAGKPTQILKPHQSAEEQSCSGSRRKSVWQDVRQQWEAEKWGSTVPLRAGLGPKGVGQPRLLERIAWISGYTWLNVFKYHAASQVRRPNPMLSRKLHTFLSFISPNVSGRVAHYCWIKLDLDILKAIH